ncbi:MAG: DUF898 domain-containing protein [Natronospirillum sp.]|uniref:YjgN family protein n=1 Tax=Natronospirillum sp. TaxID=2812955 RepID=UPI0025FDC23F|nr:YjgN family protein [Natronospirillum sp.]MCH8551263.1 DUF898 domain-containing protein [Natronospirillum sp.]
MPEHRYDIVFRGELQDNFDPEEAKARFARAFSMATERVELLFRRSATTLKSDLDGASARHYVQRLAQLGLKVDQVVRASSSSADNLSLVPTAEETAGQSHGQKDAGPRTQSNQQGGRSGQQATAEADDQPRMSPFVFSGEGREYFGIWIVNILLSIVTLGIYSAWAKVRNKQYFYGNTELDGARFEYTAEPKRILFGRLIAFVFFVVYSVMIELSAVTALLAFLALVAFMPWAIRQALRFNARYSSYRNVPFRFTGSLLDSFLAFVAWPLLAVITLGILTPMMLHRQQHFIIGNHHWGTVPFHFSAPVSAYYMMSIKLVGVLIGGGLALWALSSLGLPGLLLFILGLSLYLVLLAVFNVSMANLKFNFAALRMARREHGFEANWEVGSYFQLILVNTLATLVTLGLFTPWAKVRAALYAAHYTEAMIDGDLDDIAAAEREKTSTIAEGVGDLFDLDVGA